MERVHCLKAALVNAVAVAVPRGCRRGPKSWWDEEVAAVLHLALEAKKEWVRDPTNEAKNDH
jgi:hypothetical protein